MKLLLGYWFLAALLKKHRKASNLYFTTPTIQDRTLCSSLKYKACLAEDHCGWCSQKQSYFL